MRCFLIQLIRKIETAVQSKRLNESYFTDNVLPGAQGKVFVTDAKKHTSLELIKSAIYNVKGVKSIAIDETVFPRELKIQTHYKLPIKSIQKAVIEVGFHVVPKSPYLQ